MKTNTFRPSQRATSTNDRTPSSQPMPTTQADKFEQCSANISQGLTQITKYVTLANDRVEHSLVLIDEADVNRYLKEIEHAQNLIAQNFNQLHMICANAITSLNERIEKTITTEIDRLSQQLQQYDNGIKESNDYMNQCMDALGTQVDKLHRDVIILTDSVKPPEITREHVETAKYLIDNVKNNQGKSIKGASITIQNVAALLEAYDRMKYSSHASNQTTTTRRYK